MIVKFKHGEVRYYTRSKSFILFACDCYVEYEMTEDDWENPVPRVTDHNVNLHSLQINEIGEYYFDRYGGGMMAGGSRCFVNGVLKPLDEKLTDLFRQEFQRIMLKEEDVYTSHLMSQYFTIFRKNNLFSNQVTIHEED